MFTHALTPAPRRPDTERPSRFRLTLPLAALAALLPLLAPGTSAAQTVVYVNQNAPGPAHDGTLDLSLDEKISQSPQFDYEAFKSNASVIPFSNGYAVNLYGQKLGENGCVKQGSRPSKSYLSIAGRSLPGRLIRKNGGTVEEFVLRP